MNDDEETGRRVMVESSLSWDKLKIYMIACLAKIQRIKI